MTWLVITQVAGGVVLFLVGMQSLSGALRVIAGERMRALLTVATASRGRGLLLGTSVGFLAHSSAATVMTVGFVNAGLLSLVAALPVLFGANIGTTLSMQLVSLRLTDYALAAVALGGALQLAGQRTGIREAGRAVLGLGLVFLGLKISGDAMVPYREVLAPWLTHFDGATLAGLLRGVLIAAVVTMVVQSSGAVIGMAFVLSTSGVVTSLHQTYPIVLGAHIGTTITAVVASIGAAREARRAALANVLFNVFNAGMGVVGAGLLIPLLQSTSDDLVHQTANAHSAIMVLAAAIHLPWTTGLANLVRRMLPVRDGEPIGSFLEPGLLARPDEALRAVLHELARCARTCLESIQLVTSVLGRGETRSLRRAGLNEAAINEIRAGVQAYLAALTRRQVSQSQALLAQTLNRSAIELERIGDHVMRLARMIRRNGLLELAGRDESIASSMSQLVRAAEGVVGHLVLSLESGDLRELDARSWSVLETRNRYKHDAEEIRQAVIDQMRDQRLPADGALTFSEFAAVLERIVRHCAVVAQEERQPSFETVFLPQGGRVSVDPNPVESRQDGGDRDKHDRTP